MTDMHPYLNPVNKAMTRTIKSLLQACAVLAAVATVSCEKENPVPGIDNGYNAGYGYVGGYVSRNAEFEKDWSSQKEITLVTEYYKLNDQPMVKTIDVPLPWAWEDGPRQWLPSYTARNMAELDRDDWRLVFNLTGIDQKPGEHYFALYNRFTGTLRVFYYLTEDRIPASDANDHMWSLAMSKDLLEHVTFQYAIPYGEEATEAYKSALGGNDAVFKTTAVTAECSDAGKVVPRVGWWAYDIDMSAMRSHDFFGSDRSIMRPGMQVFHEDNVVLTSLMHGTLDGTFSGNMNLNTLKGSGTSNYGILGGLIGGFASSVLTNLKILDMVFADGAVAPGFVSLLGIALGTFGKGLETKLKNGIEDPDKLGDFNGKINLTLDATIETAGTIGGERTTLVPSPELNVSTFINRTEGLGKGVWNIEHHPVIYVVSDAYWGDKPRFSSVERTVSEGRTAYQLTVDPDNFGLRLISFLDPTSIGGVRFNPDAIPEGVKGDIEVRTSYGVMKGAAPGYTDGFRKAIGLAYTEPELSPKSAYQSDDPDSGFRIIKKPHADKIFIADIPEDQKDFLGNRLTQQQIGTNIHRRMFGVSAFYSNPSAGTDQLDDATMVSDPEVYLPVNSSDRLLFGADVPDFVVTAFMSLKAGEDDCMFHSLRFIPKVEFVKLADLQGIYSQIVTRSASLASEGISFPDLDKDLTKIKNIVDNAK